MTNSVDARPGLTADLTEAEMQRWYWEKTELVSFARELGIRATGSKELLTARIAAQLSNREFVEPARTPNRQATQLVAPLTPETVIPVGQRSSQVVRAWMREQLGAGFHFDAPMRAFFAGSDGTATMQDAIDHYRATRDRGVEAIDPQFELNRFTRAWSAQHPHGSRADLLAAWRAYRATPVDQRGRA